LDGANDVPEGDLLGSLGEEVSPLWASLGVDEVGAPKLLKDLFEVAKGHVLAASDVPGLRGSTAIVIGDIEDSANAIARFGRELHEFLTILVKNALFNT
jgi:hypothetical protein